ncbi:MAG: NrsF family protein [Bauldia sp.]
MTAKRRSYRRQTGPTRLTTDELIAALVADLPTHRTAPTIWLYAGILASAALSSVAVTLTIGMRPDIAAVAGTAPFVFKFVVTITLAVTALALVRAALTPGFSVQPSPLILLIGPALLVAAAILELQTLDRGLWLMAATGKNRLLCLVAIPALGLVPLGIFKLVLRRGAPTRPSLAGCYAGTLAGGIAATAYALYCTDDSALFMAACYTPAIGVLAGLGAALGGRLLRW